MSLEPGFQKAGDVFTVEQIQETVRTLARRNTPQWHCPACERGYYLVAAYAKDEPDRSKQRPGKGPPFLVECDCGARSVVQNTSLPLGAPYVTIFHAPPRPTSKDRGAGTYLV